MADPIALLARDRGKARELGDPWANLCALATVTALGEPAVRVLVLRDVAGRLGVFVNATSPKVAEFANTPNVAVLIHLPALGVQYRLRCGLEPMPPEVVRDAWRQRPTMPKRLDWFYERHPQSSAFKDRAALLRAVAELALPAPLAAPPAATGFLFQPTEVERLELAGEDGGLHDRRRYDAREGGRWRESALVP